MSWAESLIGAGLGVAGGIFSASQANRFAERMSSTAHQREVADLRKAGLNPMLSVNRGASSPQGTSPDVTGSAQRGVSSALAAQQQKATIELTRAQTDAASAAAGYTRGQALDLVRQGEAGKYEVIRAAAEVGKLDAALAKLTQEQRVAVGLQALEKAKEEIRLTKNSADRQKIATELDELARTGRQAEADFAKRLGEGGPAVQLLLDIVRAVGPLGIGAAIIKQRGEMPGIPDRPKVGF